MLKLLKRFLFKNYKEFTSEDKFKYASTQVFYLIGVVGLFTGSIRNFIFGDIFLASVELVSSIIVFSIGFRSYRGKNALAANLIPFWIYAIITFAVFINPKSIIDLFATYMLMLGVLATSSFFANRKIFITSIIASYITIIGVFILRTLPIIETIPDLKKFITPALSCFFIFIISNLFLALSRAFLKLVKTNLQKSLLLVNKKFEMMKDIIMHVSNTISISSTLSKIVQNIDTQIISISDLTKLITHSGKDMTLDLDALKSIIAKIETEKNNVKFRINGQSLAFEQVHSAIEEIQGSITNMSLTANTKIEFLNVVAEKISIGVDNLESAIKGFDTLINNSEQMVNSIQIIEGIAKKTNMLAMNASIEAAHAGELGKGFSVVADEIRLLAEESSINSRKISENIQATNQAIGVMAKSTKNSSVALKPIVNDINNTADEFNMLKNGLSELSKGVMDINSGAANILEINNDVTNAASAMEVVIENTRAIFEHVNESFDHILDSIEKTDNAILAIQDESSKLVEIADENQNAVNKIIVDVEKCQQIDLNQIEEED